MARAAMHRSADMWGFLIGVVRGHQACLLTLSKSAACAGKITAGIANRNLHHISTPGLAEKPAGSVGVQRISPENSVGVVIDSQTLSRGCRGR